MGYSKPSSCTVPRGASEELYTEFLQDHLDAQGNGWTSFSDKCDAKFYKREIIALCAPKFIPARTEYWDEEKSFSFQIPSRTEYYGAQTREHVLLALSDEPDRDRNHGHFKLYRNWGLMFDSSGHCDWHSQVYDLVLARQKFKDNDEIAEINRRKLVDAINEATGLNLNYLD